jgi:hypothetical protein
MQPNKLSDSLDKTKCYLDKHGSYLGKFKDTKTIVRHGQQAHSNIFKYGNSMDDNFIETPCTSNSPTMSMNRSQWSRVNNRGGRRKKRNSITKNHRRASYRASYRKSKRNNRRS